MISKVMRLAGIKKKRIIVSCAPGRRDERLEEFYGAIDALDKRIHKICKEDGHIVFTDETVFKSRDF